MEGPTVTHPCAAQVPASKLYDDFAALDIDAAAVDALVASLGEGGSIDALERLLGQGGKRGLQCHFNL